MISLIEARFHTFSTSYSPNLSLLEDSEEKRHYLGRLPLSCRSLWIDRGSVCWVQRKLSSNHCE